MVEGIVSGAPAIGATLLFVLYGALCVWIMGLRQPLLIAATAAPAAMGLSLLAAQVLGATGLGASPMAIFALGLTFSALAMVPRWLLSRRLAPTPSQGATGQRVKDPHWVWAGAAGGSVVGSAIWTSGIHDFAVPAQH